MTEFSLIIGKSMLLVLFCSSYLSWPYPFLLSFEHISLRHRPHPQSLWEKKLANVLLVLVMHWLKYCSLDVSFFKQWMYLLDTTYTIRSTLHILTGLHLEIDKGRFKTKLYDKRDDFNFPSLCIIHLLNDIPALVATTMISLIECCC